MMVDLNKDLSKMKASDFFRHLQKPVRIITEIAILFAFTVIAFTCLLYCAKYIWVIFTATQVGQTYAKMYEESYRLTNALLNRNFISLSINLTLTSGIICLIVSAVLKFLHINRFLYSERGLIIRIIFAGLPLTLIVAAFTYYRGDFNNLETALTVVFVPTLFIFTGGFKFSEEFVPEFVDVIRIFRKREKNIQFIQKEEIKQKVADQQIKLQDVWHSYAKYIIFILIIIVVAGILSVISQTSNINRNVQQAVVAAPVVTATAPAAEQEPATPKAEVNPAERFTAYPGKIVLDTKTKLMWAAEESEALSWHDAQKYCKNFRGGGYKDWRMPTVSELEGLYDPGKQPDCGCITNLIEMENGPNCWEWSSKTKDNEAAFFAFNLNGEQWLPKSNNSSVHIRPVRTHKL
jgi:hypothetical protein